MVPNEQRDRTSSRGAKQAAMSAIALTREIGSLGSEVAERLATEQGLRLAGRRIVRRLAHRMRLPEDAVRRLVQGRAGLLERWRADLDALSLFAAEEVFELAAAGNCVIRGWGATHLLRPVPHVLCVRVCAPFELRARRVMQRLGLEDPGLGAEEVRRSDAARHAAMRRRFDVDWRDPAHYDLVLNTERVPVERCVAEIRRMLELPQFQPSARSRALLEGLALAARIRAALRQDPATAAFRIRVEADLNGRPGRVTLRGVVLHEGERIAAEEVAFRFPAVRAVTNQLHLMWPRRAPHRDDG
jgi:cytidylate kinase